MSRSRKHIPFSKDRPCAYFKRCANKRVRKFRGTIANGKNYKKLFESCEIFDYRSYWSLEQAKYQDKLNLSTPYVYEQVWHRMMRK